MKWKRTNKNVLTNSDVCGSEIGLVNLANPNIESGNAHKEKSLIKDQARKQISRNKEK